MNGLESRSAVTVSSRGSPSWMWPKLPLTAVANQPLRVERRVRRVRVHALGHGVQVLRRQRPLQQGVAVRRELGQQPLDGGIGEPAGRALRLGDHHHLERWPPSLLLTYLLVQPHPTPPT